MRLLAAFLACLISTAALADSINVGPTAVGTAAAGQVPGTATNDSAAAGKVGEWITNSVASGSETALTTNTQTNISTGVTLTAGDWNCYGSTYYKVSATGTTSITRLATSLSTTTATFQTAQGGYADLVLPAFVPGVSVVNTQYLGPLRFQVASTQNVFLVAFATFTVSTLAAAGEIKCQRTR